MVGFILDQTQIDRTQKKEISPFVVVVDLILFFFLCFF